MTKELKDLEKQFILNENMEHENLQTLISRALKFAKIDKNGHVVIAGRWSIADKIMLTLTARYLGNHLQLKLGAEPTILKEVATEDLSKMLGEKQSVVSARLKDLKDKKWAIAKDRGVFTVAPYSIDDFLTKLEGGVTSAV